MMTLRGLGAVLLLAWAASLALPVFTACAPGYDHVPGVLVLLLGWFGFLILMPAWLANFLIVGIGAGLAFRRGRPVRLGGLTAVIAGSAWWWKAWADDTGERTICHYHAGHYV